MLLKYLQWLQTLPLNATGQYLQWLQTLPLNATGHKILVSEI